MYKQIWMCRKTGCEWLQTLCLSYRNELYCNFNSGISITRVICFRRHSSISAYDISNSIFFYLNNPISRFFFRVLYGGQVISDNVFIFRIWETSVAHGRLWLLWYPEKFQGWQNFLIIDNVRNFLTDIPNQICDHETERNIGVCWHSRAYEELVELLQLQLLPAATQSH